tara:strand:- start:669 stop:1196 length:528 start_codon:yes stop_codon:yes gene_type:complete
MEYINFKKSIETYADYVIKEARINLGKKDNQDGKLSTSLSYKINSTESAYIVRFFMENYGIFQDKGVRGVDSYYADKVTSSSPFSYKSKGGKFGLKGMPPPRAFDKWTVRKGLAPRDKKGRFLPRKTLDFLIARSIFKKGIRATSFFSGPFTEGQKIFGDEFLKAIAKDIENRKQ